MPVKRPTVKRRRATEARVAKQSKRPPQPIPKGADAPLPIGETAGIRPFDVSSRLVERKKPGPPPILVPDQRTLRVIQGLGQIWATQEEVAAVLGVSKGLITQFFDKQPIAREAYNLGYDQGKASLRRDQRALAKTNAAMAIFLGKNHLGQRDVQIVERQPVDLSKLNTAQIEQLLAILAAGTGPEPVSTTHPGPASGGTPQTQH